MASNELWQRFRQYFFQDEELGFALDVSRMGFDEGFLERMKPALDHAFDAMAALEAGAVANPDERRMVGHYWLRAPERAPNPDLTREITETGQQIRAFAGDLHSGKLLGSRAKPFKNFLLIGIGGSALGPQLVADALGTSHDAMKPYFMDNTDPDGIFRTLLALDNELAETLTIVISKSGGTPETRNGMLEAKDAYERNGLQFGRHAVAVTSAGSALDKVAQAEGWLATFPMWDWVGGRTSVTSAVGLLPATLQGLDTEALLGGARAMDKLTRRRDALRNPAALLALMWHWAGGGQGKKDMVILPYKDRLLLFSKYLQQLVMESIGKERDLGGNVVNQGIAVYGNKGSTDQHAYVQQLREGLNNFFATFIEVLHDDAGSGVKEQVEVDPGVVPGDYLEGFLLGTRQALAENGRESVTITIRRLDARALGMLIALYERAVGLYATLVNINAYHQPGVEAGKKAAQTILTLQQHLLEAMMKHKDAKTAEAWAEAAGVPAEAETVFKLLERFAANPGTGVKRTLGKTPFEATYSRW